MISGRWFKIKRMWSILKDMASVLGFLSILLAIMEFFPTLKPLSGYVKETFSFWIILLCSFLYAFVKNRPRNQFVFKVHNRDTEIELKVGKLEKTHASYIVPINSEFDMHLNGSVSASKSVKAMMIKKYFAGDHEMVQKRVSNILRTKQYGPQKSNGTYLMGTTVRIETDDKKRAFYFVVNSHKLNDKRVEANEDDLPLVLGGLWSYISTHGAKENIAIPLLGTGNGRMKMSREEVYKEIIRSFIASCAGKCYCDRLTIVIREEDIAKCEIDVEQLVEFTKLHTEYADFNKGDGKSTGKAVS